MIAMRQRSRQWFLKNLRKMKSSLLIEKEKVEKKKKKLVSGGTERRKEKASVKDVQVQKGQRETDKADSSK